MEIVQNRAVKLRLKNPSRVTNVIPKSAVLGEVTPGVHEVLVHFGLDEAQVLKNLKIKGVRSPIAFKYEWPGMRKPFDHQKVTSEFLTLHKRCYLLSEQGCVDSDTEYLSPTGWVKISEYSGGKVAQYHPDTRAYEFVEPDEFVKLPCDDMIRIKTKYGLDQLLSPEHRVLLHSNKAKGRTAVMSAQEVIESQERYFEGEQAVRAEGKIAFSGMSIPTALQGCGGPGLSLTDAQLRLQVAVIADGYFPSPSTTRCHVRVKKDRKKERMRTLLNNAGVKFTEVSKDYPTAKGFTIFRFYAPVRTKEFGVEFWNASKHQLHVITDEVLYWDSCIIRGIRFTTYVKASADFIQYAFASTLRTARLITRTKTYDNKTDTEYTVQVRDELDLTIRSTHRSVAYAKSTDGFKYCFSVPSTFLVFRRNGCVFASGNTGKTSSVLWAADYLLSLKKIRRVLVISPVSIMRAAWVADAFKCCMHRSIAVAHGTKPQRVAVIDSDAEIVVINYDGVATVQKELQGKFDLIVLDEATYIKNATTRRWKAINSLLEPDTWLWLMTGTPAAQSPLDAYGLAKLCTPARVPGYYGAWRDKTMVKMTMFKWKPSVNATAIVNEALQPAIRFTKEECLDLPEMLYQTREIPLSKQQEKYYNLLKSKLSVVAGGEQITAVHAAAALNKLLQISVGCVYSDQGDVVKFEAGERLTELLSVVEESSHKVVVFVPFKHAIMAVKEFLESNEVTTECIYGDVPLAKRTEIFRSFQEEADPRVLVIQPQSAAHGVTLTAASTIVWFGPTPSVETYLQGNARIHRAGQTNKTLVVRLCGSPAERQVYKALDSKEADQTKLMALYEAVLKGE